MATLENDEISNKEVKQERNRNKSYDTLVFQDFTRLGIKLRRLQNIESQISNKELHFLSLEMCCV